MAKSQKKKKAPKSPTEYKAGKAPHCKNTGLFKAIVQAGGNKRVAVIASNKHTEMDPAKNKAYVVTKANQEFDPEKAGMNRRKPRVYKTSPTSRRQRKKT